MLILCTPFVLLLATLASASARTTKCLSGGRVALCIDGGPTASSMEILALLKKFNMTALFNLDADRLSQPDAVTFAKKAEQEGHLLGLSLPKSLDLNALTKDLLRGSVERRVSDFKEATGKKPVFLRVPTDTEGSKIDALDAAGFLVVSPGFDMAGIWSGTCEQAYNSSVNKWALESTSLVISIPDSESGCSLAELKTMLNSTHTAGIKVVRMDRCLNLRDPYQRDRLDTPVDFSLYDGSRPEPTTSSSNATVNVLSANRAAHDKDLGSFLLAGSLALLFMLL